MYLAFDTETSGIHIDAQVLTAYFIILDSNFNEIDSLDLKIKYPVYSIQLKAFQVNNIDLVKHEQEALISLDAKIKLKNFLLKHKKNKYIPLGHNIKFDLDKMRSFGIYDYVSSTFNLDTMQIAQFLKSSNKLPFNQSLSLKNLTEYYGIKPTGDLHNAECDIRLTIDLFKHFQKVLTQSTSQQNTLSINSLDTQSTQQQSEIEQTAHILLNMKSKKTLNLRKRKIVKYF